MYHPAVQIANITPMMNLDSLIKFVNDSLTVDKEYHNAGQIDKLANMVRLNWMTENLKHDPIYKPILTVVRGGKLLTVTGDTRLQAIELNPHITHISCLVSIPFELSENFKFWDLVDSKETLATYLNIDADNILINQDWSYTELDWMEFSLQETCNHMHDVDQRLRMIYNYLDAQNPSFQFTKKWLTDPIDWNLYDF